MYVLYLSNYRLELGVIDACEGLHHYEVVVVRLIFHNSSLHGGEVLLIREVDVVEEGALSGQESAGDFQGFSMPVLGLFLFDCGVVGSVFLHLNDEPDLGRVAEVGDRKETHLTDERVPGHLQFVLALLQQVFESEGLELHDAANAEGLGPLTLVQVTQDVLHVNGVFFKCSIIFSVIF